VTVQSPPLASASAPLRAQGFLRRHAAKLVASAVITCGVLYTVHKGGLKLLPEATDFKAVRWLAVPLYLPMLAAMTWFRSTRWRFLLRSIAEVPKKHLLAVSCIGFLAILVMPFRIGEIVRPYMVRTRPSERRPGERAITMTSATSSVVAERVIDFLYLSIVLALALVFVPTVHPLPDKVVGIPVSVHHVRMSGYAMLVVSFLAFVTVAIFYFAQSWAQRTTLTVLGKVSLNLAQKIAGLCEKLADGLHIFSRGKDALGFLFETSLYWGCNVVGMWSLTWGCGVKHADGSAATLGEACGLMGMLGCAVLIPGPPGMLGVFQAGIYAGMTMYYPTEVVIGPGAAYVFLIYIVQVVFTFAMGAWGLWYEGGRRGLRGGLRALEEAEGIVAPADT
jgi:glycosyltransferase 2 family protein